MISHWRSKLFDNFHEGQTIFFINPYSYILIRNDASLLSSADVIMIDGFLLVKAIRIGLGIKLNRISFDMTSLAAEVFQNSVKNNKSLYLVGSTRTQINKAVETFSSEFKGLNIIGYRHGYFSNSHERNKVIHDIAQLKPHIVIVGMGASLQEKFLLDLRASGWSGTGFTCGGFFHQTAKSKGIDYYPKWIDRYNLRWLYRMYDEPKLIKRYTIDYTKFLFVFSYDVIIYWLWKIREERL